MVSRRYSKLLCNALVSTSVPALSIASGLVVITPEKAHAVCTLIGNVIDCSGTIAGGFSNTGPQNVLIVDNLTTDIDGIGLRMTNNNGSDVMFTADLPPFSIDLNPGDVRGQRTGFNIITQGAISGTLNGNLTGQTSAMINDTGTTGTSSTNQFGALGFDAGGDIDVTHTGFIDVTQPDITRNGTSRSDVGSGRFGAVRTESDTGDILVTNTGYITIEGGDRTANVTNTTSGTAGARASRFTNLVSETYGIFAQGNGDYMLDQTGDIKVTSGNSNANASTEDNIADARTSFAATVGVGLPAFTTLNGVSNPNLPRFEEIDIDITGNIDVTGGDISSTATSTSTGPMQSIGTAIAEAGFFTRDEAFGVSVGSDFTPTGTSVSVNIDGDVTVAGGSSTAMATASLGGMGETAGLADADADGQSANGVILRSEVSGPSILNIAGNVNVTGGDAIAFATGGADGEVDFNTLYSDLPDFDSPPASRAFGGLVDGVIGRVGNGSSINIDGTVNVKGGDAMATFTGTGEGIFSTATGAQSLGVAVAFEDGIPNETFTFDTDINVTGASATATGNGAGIRVSAQARAGTGLSIAHLGDNTFIYEGDITLTGSDATANATGGAEISSVNGSFGLGINNSTFGDGVTGTLINRGTINVTGGNAIANGTLADDVFRSSGGSAFGINTDAFSDGSTGRVFHEGTINVTAGAGPDTRGTAVGILAGDEFADFGPGEVRTEVVVSGTINTDGDSQEIFSGVRDGLSGGVVAATLDTTSVAVDGGTINTTGTGSNGIGITARESTVDIINGGSVTASGTNGAGIEIFSQHTNNFSLGNAFNSATSTISIDASSSVTSTNFVGILDAGTNSLGSFGGTRSMPNPELFEDQANFTTVDLAGTVTGGNGTAIDLSTGEDRLIMRSTGTANGDVDLGDGNDRFAFEDGFTVTGILDGGAGDDIIEADVAMGDTRTLDVEPLPLANFEIIEKEGQGTLNIAGATITDQLLLQANGGLSQVLTDQMNLSADVASGAYLTSQTTLANVTNGGTLSVGTMTNGDISTLGVTDNLVLETTGTLNVDIQRPNLADLIDVDGMTTLGGTLNVNALGMLDAFVVGDEFIIIESAGGVDGAFLAIMDNLPDLNIVANVVPDGMTAENVVLGLTMGDPSDKSIHPNALQAGAEAGRAFSALLRDRIKGDSAAGGAGNNAGNGATFGLSQLALSYGDEIEGDTNDGFATRQALGATFDNTLGIFFWMAGFGSFRDVEGTAAATGYDAYIGGVAFGIENVSFNSDALVTFGLAGGYSYAGVDNGASSADIDSWHIGAYGEAEFDDWRLAGTLSYSFQDYDLDRVVPVPPAFVTANGEADGHVFAGSLEVSRNLVDEAGLDGHLTYFAPFARIEHVIAERNGFTETGAGVLNLTVGNDDFDRSFSTLGLQMAAEHTAANGIAVRSSLEIGWEHAFNDTRAVSNSIIAGVAGAAFTSPGAAEDRDRLALGLGIEMQLTEGLSAVINYDGTYGSGFSDHRGSGSLTFRF
ncbi:MAG: autotransporter domain-containing protein [Rhizobiaceae bacterium]|nr:autotransporter domain-containing protein [Rhizobiaceae bacterium]